MITELVEYRVIGTIKTESGYFCDCEHCEGHGKGVIDDVDYTVEAVDEEHAKSLAELQYTESNDYPFGEWITVMILAPGEKPPRPREVELEMLKRWNEGHGLPAGEEPLKFGFVAARGVLQ